MQRINHNKSQKKKYKLKRPASEYRSVNNNMKKENSDSKKIGKNSLSPDDSKAKKEIYPNKYSLERINFDLNEYGLYPDENFLPSVFFFKFLAPRSELKDHKRSRLKLYIPDTIVLNDIETNYWMFTDMDGNVTKIDLNSDAAVLEKFKSPTNDNTELLGVCKNPIFSKNRLVENRLELLNYNDLERNLFSKNSSQFLIQKFVKCRGPKAFICRSVWRRNKPSYVYILTNKLNYNDTSSDNMTKFVVNSKSVNSYNVFHSASGRHFEETNKYMNNIVKYIEFHSDIIFEEDQAGICWFINIKAMKINNIYKFLDCHKQNINWPNLEFFLHRRRNKDETGSITKKFDYQTKIKCKFCGVDYSAAKLKYNLTTKMIFETGKMLKNFGNQCPFTDRPDLKHSDCSVIYLPYRVCEDCYLLFETTNDIKNYQLEIANYFRIPVDPINFGMYYNKKEEMKRADIKFKREEKKNELNFTDLNTHELNPSDDSDIINNFTQFTNDYVQTRNSLMISPKKVYHMHRILVMFTDLFLNESVKLPEKELFLRFNFLGNYYKVKLGTHYPELDYCNINFFKIFYIVCEENKGFIEYVEKNRQMEVQLGYYNQNKLTEDEMKKISMIFNKSIIIEDKDVCNRNDDFVEFAKVELSLQGLKYGENYRNTLNGLMFKQTHPHYVAKLRCLIRISNEGREKEYSDKSKDGKENYKNIDVTKLNCRKHFNFFIPPINFVVSEELQDYWLELVERHKLRESILDSIMNTMKKNSIEFIKKDHKDNIFLTLETLVSHYLNKSTEYLFNSYNIHSNN